MLMPKRVKRRMQQRGRMKGKATRGNTLAYGEYGLVAMDRYIPTQTSYKTTNWKTYGLWKGRH